MNSSWRAKVGTATAAGGLTGATAADERMSLAWLAVAALVTVALWQIPYGNYIAYPFTILATWFHEMGHGLTALLLGGQFTSLVIYPDGSGIAYHTAPANDFLFGRIKDALVAMGGPMGPPIAGALFILTSRRLQTARVALVLLATALLLTTVIWVRSIFGFVFLPLIAAAILAVVLRAPRWAQGFTIQLLGVQACISTFQQVNYLFTADAVIGGQSMLSDSSQVAVNLLLPYWFWGGLMVAGSLLLLCGSLFLRYRPQRPRPTTQPGP